MSEYVPRTHEVRNAVGFIPVTTTQMRFSEYEAAKFDRWLAEVVSAAKAEGMEEAAQISNDADKGMNGTERMGAQWQRDLVAGRIRARAAVLRETGRGNG